MSGGTAGSSSSRMFGLTCTGPIKYIGHAIVQHDIANLKSALGGARRRRSVHDGGVAGDDADPAE